MRAASQTYHYDMSFTHAEFRLYLAGATGESDYRDEVRANGGTFDSLNAGKAWRITLSAERLWRMPNTLLAMPRIDVQIELFDFEETEAKRWMDRFHVYYKRGGG